MKRTLGIPGALAIGLLVFVGSARGGAGDGTYDDLIRDEPGVRYRETFDPGGPVGPAASLRALPRGTVEPTAGPSTLRLGGVARLGRDGYLVMAEPLRATALTVELWVRLREEPEEDLAAIYASDGWDAGKVHVNLRRDGSVELAVNGAGSQPATEPGALKVGRWTHFAAVVDPANGTMGLFVDGRPAAEGEIGPEPPLNISRAAVGAWINGEPSRLLRADIDELVVYDRALNAADLRRHVLAAAGESLPPVDYAARVRPILEEHCLDCHGPESAEGGLRLDIRSLALLGGESGEPAINPYDGEGSELIRRLVHEKDEARMPSGGPRLGDAEIAAVRAWIDQGAPWPDELAGVAPPEVVSTDQWAFRAPERKQPPGVDDRGRFASNPVDAFIVEKLTSAGLGPSPEADRRMLIRRLYLDVLGIPPSPEEVRAFVDDDDPLAWSRLVDRVLASPRYGERWASHWLDVIRYGDTHGFEVNTPRENAWPYRDYVIRALNDDEPFDRFLRDQLVGEGASTGFLVAAPALLPGQVGRDEASKRQARADELHEIIVSVGSGVMGLTVGCARCHNHKFDPISQRDYYRMQAIFAGVRYGDRSVADAGAPTAFAGVFGGTGATYRLYRGDPMQRRERVGPDVPAVLGSLTLDSTAADPDRRRALAEWLAGPENPLTSRVIVNRIWQHHFGTGLVATPSDFGKMGAPPSHPELLDWLAIELVHSGWSLKSIHRLILNSSTYRQTGRPRAEGLAVDANDRLLWRFPPRRLDMEPIRDSILSVSGALDTRMGGPGFLVFKPNDNYVRVYEPREEWDPSHWRRSVYAHRVRMAQDGVFGAFDCPDAGQPAPRRSRSTTAIQALNLLNSTFVDQQAGLLADRAKTEAGGDESAAVDRVFQLAIARSPSEGELAGARDLSASHGLDAVARAILNSNEFLFLP